MKFAAGLCVLPTLFGATLGLVTPRVPTKGPVSVAEWEVEVTPGGPTVHVNGTVQEVRAQLLKINPNYDSDFPLPDDGHLEHLARDIEARAEFDRNLIECQPQGIDEANRKRIQEGIGYLRSISGIPRAGPGPGFCRRVSCSYNAAIWWCNNGPDYVQLNSFSDIADGADAILKRCAPLEEGWVVGVAHHDPWAVIVRFDENSC